eukprot:scpid79609/ scgid17927/ 
MDKALKALGAGAGGHAAAGLKGLVVNPATRPYALLLCAGIVFAGCFRMAVRLAERIDMTAIGVSVVEGCGVTIFAAAVSILWKLPQAKKADIQGESESVDVSDDQQAGASAMAHVGVTTRSVEGKRDNLTWQLDANSDSASTVAEGGNGESETESLLGRRTARAAETDKDNQLC